MRIHRLMSIHGTFTPTAPAEHGLLYLAHKPSMTLPLLVRATEDGLRFGLTPAGPAALPTSAPRGAVAARMPLRAPSAGEQYRFHLDMGKCIGCKCCVVACNEQNANPA